MNIPEKTGLEIKEEAGMKEPEILSLHPETEEEKEIPDHRLEPEKKREIPIATKK